MPGPPPKPAGQRRRKNQPTIPTTELPVDGRDGPAPDPPYELGMAGRAWWDWAWALPQACAWTAGDLYALARRAAMEDPKTMVVGKGDDRMAIEIEGGTANEKLQLDDRFGLTTKGMISLRWTIVEVEAPAAPKLASVAPIQPRRAVG